MTWQSWYGRPRNVFMLGHEIPIEILLPVSVRLATPEDLSRRQNGWNISHGLEQACPEVSCKLIIHCQLAPETGRVLENHHHHAKVLYDFPILPHGRIFGFSSDARIIVLPSWHIPTETLHAKGTGNHHHGGKCHWCAPSSIFCQACVHHGFEEHWYHEDLCRPSTCGEETVDWSILNQRIRGYTLP